MHLSYKARYYNGHSSTPYIADISIHEAGIHISYINERGEHVTLDWAKEVIKETELSSAVVVLRYGETFPYQQLDITDRDFLREYKEHFHISTIKRWLHFRTHAMFGLIVIGFLVCVTLGYLFLLPLAADQVARSFPQDYEISMGNQIYESVLKGTSIDTARTEAINHFFRQLNIKTAYPVKITVVKDSIVNAFALPGGGIVVYDTILKKMDRPEDLAALLSHEFSHVELKHATRNVFRSLASYMFMSVIFSDLNGIATIVVQNAENLRSLKYSRELEHEADANGLLILEQNKIDPKGMINLFEQLKKEDHKEVSEILSTHPELDSRIGFVRTFQKEHPYHPLPNDSLTFYFNQLKKGAPSW